jgi:hypothetical protein
MSLGRAFGFEVAVSRLYGILVTDGGGRRVIFVVGLLNNALLFGEFYVSRHEVGRQ